MYPSGVLVKIFRQRCLAIAHLPKNSHLDSHERENQFSLNFPTATVYNFHQMFRFWNLEFFNGIRTRKVFQMVSCPVLFLVMNDGKHER